MKLIQRKKCFVKNCNQNIPIYKYFRVYITLFCDYHEKIFMDLSTKEEIEILKEMGVDMVKLRESALKYDKDIKQKYPSLFEDNSVIADIPTQK